MSKVGIMGGTFNPIHFGHLFLAEQAYVQIGLDKVLFMPSKNPPHKMKPVEVSEQQRVNMINLAISDNPHFELSTFELLREGLTFTAETLTLLKKSNPDTEYYFIVGADSLFMMQNWKMPQVVFELCTVVAAGRDNAEKEQILGHAQYLKQTFGANIIYLDMPTIQISSGDIRSRIADGMSVRYYMPEKVIEYIVTNKLYETHLKDKARSDIMEVKLDLQLIRDDLKKILKDSRYQHSTGVEEVAHDLALIYGYDTDKAITAGILHDCAKNLTDQELLEACRKYQLSVSDIEKKCLYLLHAKVGAALSRDKYGVCDDEILNAITYHTTGRPAMTLLEKILFTADYIEPYRKPLPRIDEIREAAYRDLDLAVYMILDNMLNYLQDTGGEIDTLTVQTYDYYKEYIGK